MSDKVYNYLILIVDQQTNGIVCSAHSDAHAAAILLGMPNGKAIAQEKFFKKNDPFFEVNFNKTNKHYQLRGNFNFALLPDKFVTQKWIDYRELILTKSEYLLLWEFKIRQCMNTVNDFYGLPNMMPFLTEQLSLCDPKNNFYTRAVTEWGDIQEVPPSVAFQELKIRQEGYGLVYMRSHALYFKHAKNISMANTVDEIDDNFYSACEELLEKTRI